jgi:RluA family pseudouridine synthase
VNTIQLLFFDKNILVVDKPAGLSVHNNEDPQNLLQILEKQLNINKILPVHRLDKETSGVQILALNSKTASDWAKEFEEKRTQKTYAGILKGTLPQNSGTWSRPLSDKAEGRKNPQGLAKNRVPCETQFQVLKNSRHFTLCELNLLTGRQHQIRKHAALSNHAIVGDPRYNDPKYNQKIAQIYSQKRMFLHCKSVQILSQSFVSELPTDFSSLLDQDQA